MPDALPLPGFVLFTSVTTGDGAAGVLGVEIAGGAAAGVEGTGAGAPLGAGVLEDTLATGVVAGVLATGVVTGALAAGPGADALGAAAGALAGALADALVAGAVPLPVETVAVPEELPLPLSESPLGGSACATLPALQQVTINGSVSAPQPISSDAAQRMGAE